MEWSAPLIWRKGRPFGFLVLLVLLAVQNWALPLALVDLRHALFDSYQIFFPREPTELPVTIVAVDEPSLERLGQWPWPRSVTARLMERIAQAKPVVVGVDILMPEPDRFSPDLWMRHQPGLSDEQRRTLAQLPSNDHLLGEAIRGTPTVLGFAGLHGPSSSPAPAP
ncbi:MAG: CHASE2 domain-containing protein, partial [Magnetococcales bacterium]|nr:CHASE2 domain-containing protein [Magnetococcales bacterium]